MVCDCVPSELVCPLCPTATVAAGSRKASEAAQRHRD
jgi:hypothetical protein